MKGGNYLSSRVAKPSTFGVRELNFCVRDGNRWILSAIVTTMVYKVSCETLYHGLSLKVSPFNDIQPLSPRFELLALDGIHFRRRRLNLPNPFGFLSDETNERSSPLRRFGGFPHGNSSQEEFREFSQTDNYTANTGERM